MAVPQRRDEELYRHIRENIILWNSDAAGDEQLAGNESRIWTPSANDVRPLLPNLVFVHRDKAHAGRRVLRRPWLADEVLKGVHSSCVGMFSVIQHSPAVKSWYQEAQRAMPSELKVQKDLAWREMRFDSSAKPFAIMVMTFDSIVATAIRNVTERKHGSSGREVCHAILCSNILSSINRVTATCCVRPIPPSNPSELRPRFPPPKHMPR